MKKILAILLALVVMLSFAACGADTDGGLEDNNDQIGANDQNNNAADADVCYECGDELDADDEGWMSSVYDDDGNMIDVYICDDCWEAEQNGDADADVDAGATGDADVDAGATEDNDDADETTNGGYTGTPQYSNDGSGDGELVECSVCGKKITEAEACIEATVVGTTVERTYYCNDCFEE